MAVLLMPAAVPVAAQVSANGFAVKHSVNIAAPPAKVFTALVERVGEWWHPAHTYSNDSRNLSIEARAGGCFCERLPDGGVEHMRVVYIDAPRMLRMSGTLGPLQASGLAGSLTWKLTAAGDSTTLDMSYSVGGYIEGGFEKIAPAVQRVMSEQVERLKLLMETGSPTKAKGR